MQIALFGATGGTGREVVKQAMEQGHRIKALVRDPAKLAGQTGLEIVVGDVLDQGSVDACVAGADAVICILGSHGSRAPIEAEGTRRILQAMQAQGIRRIVAVTSIGVGDSRKQLSWAFRVVMDLMLKQIMRAKEEQEALLRASDLDWIIVRPAGLVDGPRTRTYRYGVDLDAKAGRISRADVADFVLKQLTDDQFLRKAPGVI